MNEILGFLLLTMPLPLILIWVFLTWLLWKGGRRFVEASFANRPVLLVLMVVIAALWFGVAFWEGGGKKLYWDAKVREMCTIDGGVKVYEQVVLPEERFDKWGNIGVPNKLHAKQYDDYYFESDTTYLKQGSPMLVRSVTRIIRRSDGRVLGESIRYGRSGGDLPGPWHPSSYGCPPIRELGLESSIFMKGVE